MEKTKEDLMHGLILDRGERLFVAQGYHQTSMDQIAAASGISKPTLYRYFKNKYEIFLRMFARFQDDFRSQARAVLCQEKSAQAVIDDLIELLFRISSERKDLYLMMIREHHLIVHRNVDMHIHMWVNGKQEMIGLLSPLLEKALRPEVLAEFGVAEAASAFYNIMEGIFFDQLFNEHYDANFHKRFVNRLLCRGVLKEEE